MTDDAPPAIRVIDLWPTYFDCQGCQSQVLHATAWPFYEDFLDPDKPPPPWATDVGYVPVCDGCADRLADRFRMGAPPL